ncbi:MAG: gliding motility lipoprotein GldH [Bacteroidales bacterium]|nr:gliding motility lipoprotein GldH [Bacteroidales bacterium]MDG1902326.1 gliding motility lipoprotein GldH [Bacteroidales bacterium]MDG2081306.1 gliding motility lipoprotein GldH [Bacteroidales bacterium]
MIKKLILILLVGITIISCQKNTIINQSIDIPSEGWHKNNAVEFKVDVQDSLQNYDFQISIRNTINYRYSNLYVFLITEFPNGNFTRDTLEFMLANPEGKWLGTGWSSIKENNILLNKNMRFPISGEYRLLLQQAMRTDTLEGINSLGISVYESSN